MKHIGAVAALTLGCAALGAFVSLGTTLLGSAPASTAVLPAQVVIYRAPAQVARHHEEVALFISRADSN